MNRLRQTGEPSCCDNIGNFGGSPSYDCVPYSHDQPDNATRLQRLGTSRTISRDRYYASRVAKELRELLENPSYAANAKAIAQVVRAEDGVGTACDAIEKQLQSMSTI